jgi:hypothetical protein
MSDPTLEKTLLWKNRIQTEVGKAARSVLDKLVAIDPAGFKKMTHAERTEVHDLIAREIADTMLRLGTFITAGAQDSIQATLSKTTITGADKVKSELIPVLTPQLLTLLAANAGKTVVVSFTNAEAYNAARESLKVAIHREQTDWVNGQREDEARAEEQSQSVIVGTTIRGSNTAYIDQMRNVGRSDAAKDESAAQADEANDKQADAREAQADATIQVSAHAEGELIDPPTDESGDHHGEQNEERSEAQPDSAGPGPSRGFRRRSGAAAADTVRELR